MYSVSVFSQIQLHVLRHSDGFKPDKCLFYLFFHSHTMHLDIIIVFYLPTDAQESCFNPYPANMQNMVSS